MDPEYEVFEVSSDEDVGLSEKLGFDDSEDDCDWIQELLDEVDRATDDSNDSDDVVLVSEVVVNNPKPKVKNSDTGVKSFDDDDDDCVVLDGDPDKPETVENNPTVDESEELQVVGETGQVACRDYPHPRHLCFIYPFASTAHEKHCNQCHCYVCDSLAPCLHWDINNHCHATDKEEFWKNERKFIKNGHRATVSVPKVPTLSAEVIQICQGPVSVPFEATYILPGQVPPLPPIHACSRSTNFASPGVDHSGQVVPRNRFRPNLVLQHLRGTGNNVIQRDKRHTAANTGLQVKSPPSVFKRTGPGTPLLPFRKYTLSNQTYETQFMRRPPPMPTPVHNNSMRWQPLRAQMGSENTYQLPSQPSIHTNVSNSFIYQPQLSSTPNVMNHHLNMMPSQPMVSPQYNAANVFASSVTSQPRLPSRAYFDNILRPISSQPQLSFQPVIDNSYANRMPPEPLIYGQPDSTLNEYQNAQHVNQDLSFLDSTLADIDLGLVNLNTESNQQPPSQHQDIGFVNETVSLPQKTETDDIFSGSTNLDALNFEYDSWTLGSSDNPVHSPEPDISDSSFFFGL